LSLFGLYGIAQAAQDSLSFNAALLFPTLLACLCGNVYIVGLNQLEDIEIDRINKPHLPLASGEFTRRQGWLIVGITGGLAVLLALLQGPFLLATVSLSLGLGTAYSLPPIRLKRFPFWAAFCILTVRGAVINVGLFLHFNQALQGPSRIPPQVWALTLFILVFSIVIALFKDIPDLEGDRLYQINTLTVRLGKQNVFALSRWILTTGYVGMALAGILGLPDVNRTFLIVSHLVILGFFGWQSLLVDLQDKAAIAAFYQLIWKLFFMEYLIFPIACWLG
jgi:homogentisate phytyltransferase/homogentisate geranylgeranyltransferase